MILSIGMYFVTAMAASIIGLIFLAAKLHKEHLEYNSELHFFLRQRTIAHNQEKAKKAVLQTKYDLLKKEHISLKDSFASGEMEKLELEISSIKDALNGNIKEHLSEYLKEVDGLSQRLGKAKEDFNAQKKGSIEFINSKEIA